MFCAKCGFEFSDGSQFCAKCGQPTPDTAPALIAAPEARIFDTHFGSAFAIDEFGFVRAGSLAITNDTVTLKGKRHIELWKRILIWLAIAILPYFVIKLGAPLIAFVVVYYFCVSPAQLAVRKQDIQDVKVSRRQITFRAPNELGKFRRTLFHARTTDQAVAIAALLGGAVKE